MTQIYATKSFPTKVAYLCECCDLGLLVICDLGVASQKLRANENDMMKRTDALRESLCIDICSILA